MKTVRVIGEFELSRSNYKVESVWEGQQKEFESSIVFKLLLFQLSKFNCTWKVNGRLPEKQHMLHNYNIKCNASSKRKFFCIKQPIPKHFRDSIEFLTNLNPLLLQWLKKTILVCLKIYGSWVIINWGWSYNHIL